MFRALFYAYIAAVILYAIILAVNYNGGDDDEG